MLVVNASNSACSQPADVSEQLKRNVRGLSGFPAIVMVNEEHFAFICGKIVAICEAMLNEEIGVIAGSRRLHWLQHELAPSKRGDLACDEDFIMFVAISSETDHLPVDFERQNWSLEALERKDQEIVKMETLYKAEAHLACKRLIERFDLSRGI